MRLANGAGADATLGDTGLGTGWLDTGGSDFFASVDLEGGASMLARLRAAPTPSTALYLTEPGDMSAISVNDLHQGQLGDCYLISSIGEIAIQHPSMIQSMIKANANGTETVTLYGSGGSAPSFSSTTLTPIAETVTNSFDPRSVNNAPTQDVVNGVKEIWPQVIEKAAAQLSGGYNAIANGGSPVLAEEMLTGKSATWTSPSSVTASSLSSLWSAGDLIVMDTASSGTLPFNLVNNHAYMFEGLSGSGSSASVKLGNPWGTDQPAAIPLAQLSRGIVEVDIGRVT